MNKQRRKRIEKVIEKIGEIKTEIEEIREEEQDAFDNLPESFQYSEKGETMEQHIDNLDNAEGAAGEVEDYLNEVIEN